MPRQLTVHRGDAGGQSLAVGDLDGQAGAGVGLQQQRALVAVQHDVDPQVAQRRPPRPPGRPCPAPPASTAPRNRPGWRPCRDGGRPAGCTARLATSGPVSRSTPAPMPPWCRLARPPDSLRRQPEHGHHGDLAIQDHADVADALAADPLEGRVQAARAAGSAPRRAVRPASTAPRRCSTPAGGRRPGPGLRHCAE